MTLPTPIHGGVGLPADAHILTPHGFRRLSGIRPGDKVTGRTGTPVGVRSVRPQGNCHVYEIRFDDATVTCAEGHPWLVSAKPAPDLCDTFIVDAAHLAASLKRQRGLRLHVPLPQPAQFDGSPVGYSDAYRHGSEAAQGQPLPRSVFLAPPAARRAVILGVTGTSGAHSSREVRLPNPEVASQVQWLVGSLGGTCRIGSTRKGQRLHISLPGEDTIPEPRSGRSQQQTPSRTIVDAYPAGSAECLQVHVASPDKMWVTDNFVVIH